MRVVLKRIKAPNFAMLSVASLMAFVLAVLLVRDLVIHKEGERDTGIKDMIFAKGNRTVITSRKLQQFADDRDMNRIGVGCSKNDISISQAPVAPLPSGVPAFRVQITNTCPNNCRIGSIHVRCGMFTSVTLVNPNVFRRLAVDDCLANNGQALDGGKTISFQYANTFSYPLTVSSVVCLS